ncbi:MAG: hypothetical protein FJW23_07795 [Acidimicrobiia bacterium]|nr:hypothetical protein [Acidimicrobiia bacterium]
MCPTSATQGRRTGPVLVGALLIAFGVTMILGLRGFWGVLWPFLLIAWGTARLVTHRGSRWFGGLAVLAGALFLGNNLFGWDLNPFRLLVPALLIVAGLHLIFAPRPWTSHRRRAVRVSVQAPPGAAPDEEGAPREDRSASLREFAFMGGVDRRNTSQTFRGGEITAVMGGVQLDLRECRMAEDGARIEVFACMGGVSLRIPRDWTVESEIPAILGGVDDQSEPPVEGTTRRLVLTGHAILGGVEIKN